MSEIVESLRDDLAALDAAEAIDGVIIREFEAIYPALDRGDRARGNRPEQP